MITERDLEQAIAECQGERNPNASTCIKLAAFLTIRQELYGKAAPDTGTGYSYSAEPSNVQYHSDTEFGRALAGHDAAAVLPIVDELLTTIQVTQPRLYDAVMRRVENALGQ